MVWAVHISDGILQPLWLEAGFVLAALLWWLGCRRIRDEEIPRIALFTAVFFIASTLHVPVSITSVHLLFNGLVGVVLGWRAGLAIPIGLLLQAVLLQHGGFLTLGVNTCVLTIPALIAWLVFQPLHQWPTILRPWGRSTLVAISSLTGILCMVYGISLIATNFSTRVEDLDLGPANRITFHPLTLLVALAVSVSFVWVEQRMENAPEFPLGLLVGVMTVLLTAALNCLVLLLGGETNFSAPPLILLLIHLPIAVVEGIVLGITVGFLQRVKPEMLGTNGHSRGTGIYV